MITQTQACKQSNKLKESVEGLGQREEQQGERKADRKIRQVANLKWEEETKPTNEDT